MKKLTFIFFSIVIFVSFTFGANNMLAAFGAGMMGRLDNSDINWDEITEHTIREEAEGKEIWDKLQAKQLACVNLDDEQFGVLGEYFMGKMIGDSHTAMNGMMIQMHGEEGEEQIHIVMGKRLSGCDASAVATGISGGWMPMMNMMTGGWSSPFGNNSINNMMNFGYGFGFFGWIFMFLWWALIIAGIIALIKWLAGGLRGDNNGYKKSPLEILQERYARGEIDKREFEEKKKDLS